MEFARLCFWCVIFGVFFIVDLCAAKSSAYFKAGGLRNCESGLFWFHRLVLCSLTAVALQSTNATDWWRGWEAMAIRPWEWPREKLGEWLFLSLDWASHATLTASGWRLFIKRERLERDADPEAFLKKFELHSFGIYARATSPAEHFVSEGPDAQWLENLLRVRRAAEPNEGNPAQALRQGSPNQL